MLCTNQIDAFSGYFFVFDAGVDFFRKLWFDSFIELRAAMKAILRNKQCAENGGVFNWFILQIAMTTV